MPGIPGIKMSPLDRINTLDSLFLPSNLAQTLKTKGFDEPCFGWYDLKRGESELLHPPKSELHRNSEWSSVSAPLYQQVILWLLNKGFVLQTEWLPKEKAWLCDIYDKRGDFIFSHPAEQACQTIQEAWNLGIEKAMAYIR